MFFTCPSVSEGHWIKGQDMRLLKYFAYSIGPLYVGSAFTDFSQPYGYRGLADCMCGVMATELRHLEVGSLDICLFVFHEVRQ